MPRFVVLEHSWNGVHWDLMLEVGDRLRTWAIDAAIIPEADLPARELADHRLIYLNYEGTIAGNRGSVRRIDGGEYAVSLWTAERVIIQLSGAQLVGEMELRRVGTEGGGPPVAWRCRLGKAD